MNLTMGRNKLTKLNEKASCICGKAFQENSSYGFGKPKRSIESFFKINFPMYSNIKSEDHVIKPYRTHQLLRRACCPKDICSQASR